MEGVQIDDTRILPVFLSFFLTIVGKPETKYIYINKTLMDVRLKKTIMAFLENKSKRRRPIKPPNYL